MKDGLGYLGVAYIVIWTAIGCYLLMLGRRQHSLDKRLARLQTELHDTEEREGSR